ncbi:MAG: hypothetical protein Terrestrivirus4_169 [Terrestrivirus sp.]|uniref:Uncharacterized protein n=1 Tax=Terrestrivirus sp. TaxID=2487775 RepID=A0A3G4ZQ65_9VIRU|nr:MAG: hypothetical protein Terrestrivirus4_169 [Terrestrivirus sp.]
MSIFKLFKKTNKSNAIHQLEEPPTYNDICPSHTDHINSTDSSENKQISKSLLKKISSSPSNTFVEFQDKFSVMVQKTLENKMTQLVIDINVNINIDKQYDINFVSNKGKFGFDPACLFKIVVKNETIKSTLTTLLKNICGKMNLSNIKSHENIVVYFDCKDFFQNDVLKQKYDEICKSILTDKYVKSINDDMLKVAGYGATTYILKTESPRFLFDYIKYNKIFNDIDVKREKDEIIFTWDK